MMRKFLALGAAAALAVTGFAASAASAQEAPEQQIGIAQQMQPKINEVLAQTIEPRSGLQVDGIEVYNPGRVNLQGYTFLACQSDVPQPMPLGTIEQSTRLLRTALADQAGWRFNLTGDIDRFGAVVMVNPSGVAVDTVDFSQGASDVVVECLRQIPQAAAVVTEAPSPSITRSAQRTPDYSEFAMFTKTPTFTQVNGAPN